MSHFVDASLIAADSALRTLFAPHRASRPTPVPTTLEAVPTELSEADQALSAALMRVNHVGEICAQALYTSQALAARLGPGGAQERERLARHLEAAGQEETDHLAWCKQRLDELGSRPSLLNPLWYAGAFGIGLLAGRLGRATSLGFVIETERQVEAHLDQHLDQLPAQDHVSRAIVQQMKADEIRHADEAQAAGGMVLPAPVRAVMRASAKVMTTIARRI
ncbi:2-polyprenyl-3-methyl-6-methoxy-1,4-benzoquinone monooxygenase [Malikia sp.]|uniref:2-polyprenyl-3-methyl-6-methoxy-1,4-benzoquinone monooxygenase n=1 Tax=Malikia sp. TaxID=2070706 RepID=UPI00262EC9B1|nr:2-polyprenyl-3-methyl-6-methoxy-1,4-benzoquinone monooxygenase [Malikia sp.]MDD2730323.1 2-polyprenyl-3-methyl-6-methoxy-1,4-benzoquinone monooxygenase [Malikia sp.]